jgi:hypothetical protein
VVALVEDVALAASEESRCAHPTNEIHCDVQHKAYHITQPSTHTFLSNTSAMKHFRTVRIVCDRSVNALVHLQKRSSVI